MALQFSTTIRNGLLDAIETLIGASALLQVRSGSAPAACADADSGTLLAELSLPADWMASASAGSKAKAGTWEDLSANATGTAAHFRIKTSDGSVCHLQGTVTVTGGGGDLTLSSADLVSGQTVTITAFALSIGHS